MNDWLAPTSTAASESMIRVASTGTQWTEVTPLGDDDSLRPSLKNVESLSKLNADWDGYGSPPPNRFLLQMAETFFHSLWRLSGFLPVAAVVPISGGAIQLEWTTESRELEVALELGDHDPASVQVRVLRSVDGVPSGGGELKEPKEIVPHLMWLIEG